MKSMGYTRSINTEIDGIGPPSDRIDLKFTTKSRLVNTRLVTPYPYLAIYYILTFAEIPVLRATLHDECR